MDARAKHIDIKYHHIRDEVKLEYCETSVMLADDEGTARTASQEPHDGARHQRVFALRGRIEGYGFLGFR